MVRCTDGTVIRGESVVREVGKAVSRVEVEPSDATAPQGVHSAIEAADVVVLSPGSLFTNLIPALLGAGVREALAHFPGPVVYAANVMTQPGETVGFTVSDHLLALERHVGSVVTDVLVHSGELPEQLVARYEAEGAAPVEVDREQVEKLGIRVREGHLLSDEVGTSVRHDPHRLAEEMYEAALVRL